MKRSRTYGETQITPSTYTAPNKILSIQRNLHAALEHLRLPDRRRTLWADAICINQADAQEKERQVVNMKYVYSQAERVLVWLGEAPPNSTALNTIEWLMPRLPDFKSAGHIRVEQTHERSLIEASDHVRVDPRSIGELGLLYSLPWFSRLWVVQEVVNAREVVAVYGSKSTPFNYIEDVGQNLFASSHDLGSIPELHSRGGDSTAGSLSTITSLRKGRHHNDFTKILSMFGFQQCTDPRDRLYALLGLLDNPDGEGITPDYSQDYLTIFREHTILTLVNGYSLGHLVCCTIPADGEPTNDWPSWVPDWTRNFQYTPSLGTYVFCYAANGTPPSVRVSADHNVLHIFGKAVDVVDTKAELCAGYRRYDDIAEIRPNSVYGRIRFTSFWLRECFNIAFPAPSKEVRTRLILENHCADPPDGGIDAGAKIELQLRDDLAGFLETVNDDCIRLLRVMATDTMFLFANKSGDEWQRYRTSAGACEPLRNALKSLYDVSWQRNSNDLFIGRDLGPDMVANMTTVEMHFILASYRRFCKTRNGRLGFLPPAARKGDIICILYGGNVPFVLRPGQDRGTYQLVGECWIEELMYGEALDMIDIPEQEFHIR